MRPRPWIAAAAVAAAAVASPAAAPASDEFAFFHENVMGTSLELRVRADSAGSARAAEARVLGEIDRLAAVFSGYDPSSEFRRWQDAPAAPSKVSPDLFALLAASDRWREATGGAFDPRVEGLTRLWSASAKLGRVPGPDAIARVRDLSARPAWRLDPGAKTAERLAGGPLTLNAIAKGYIVGRASEAAGGAGQGVSGVVLNVGGDMRVSGDEPRTLGIVDPAHDSETSEPFAFIEVKDRAVATSGRSQRGFRIGGRWYSHVFDPRTGRPADRVAGATVVAEDSADADALATALNVLPPEDGVRLADRLPGVACLVIGVDGRAYRSEGWARYERPRPVALALADDPKPKEADDPDAWGNAFELAVSFEINRPEADGGRYRRPYVAVWVENKEEFPVRNLALWVSQGGAGPFQWVPDMKRWYLGDKARKKVDKRDMVLTISRPTRPPGQYSVVWDGKDDRGKPLPKGDYTVYIDAAREHGTYGNIRIPVTIGETPFAAEGKGNAEVKSASVEYRRKAPGK